MFTFNSSKTEVRFPVNIGITGHVATTGEVHLRNISNTLDHIWPLSKYEEGSWKYETYWSIFDKLRGQDLSAKLDKWEF